MRGEYFSYHISIKVKPQITAILMTLPRKCISTLKKNILFAVFLIDTCLMINFIIKIDTDSKY